MKKGTTYIYSALISFLYVGFGTIIVLYLYPEDPFFGDWIRNSFWATLPVGCISFAYRYAEPNSYFPIFLIQLGVFILTSEIIYRIFFKNKVGDFLQDL